MAAELELPNDGMAAEVADELEGFHMEDEDEGMAGFEETDLHALQEQLMSGSPADATAALLELCRICGKNKRQKNQMFCAAPCGGIVRSAGRQAKDIGPEAEQAFKALRKSNPDEFVVAIHTFQAKCASHGRGHKRPVFQWVRYYMAIVMSSRLQRGTRCMWLTRFAFAHQMKIEKGMTEPEAFQEFQREISMLPEDRVSKDQNEILWPVERFVISMEERAQEEHTQYGTKDLIGVSDSCVFNVLCVHVVVWCGLFVVWLWYMCWGEFVSVCVVVALFCVCSI